MKGDPENKQCKSGNSFIRKINKYVNKLDDNEKKIADRIEAATDLLEIDQLPVFYSNKANHMLCKLYTDNKQYAEAKKACDYVIAHRSSLDESIDVVDAYCNIASGLLAEDKFEEARRVIQDAMKDHERNEKVSDGEDIECS